VLSQLNGNTALATAAGYLSLLIGKEIPSSVAMFAAVHMDGCLRGSTFTKGCLDAAKAGTITTIFTSNSAVRLPMLFPSPGNSSDEHANISHSQNVLHGYMNSWSYF
jgi:hypothetical protein